MPPLSTVHKILQTFETVSYKYQWFQHVTAQDKELYYIICCDIISDLEGIFISKIVFSDKATFHLPPC
jgi:hypothetical protein